MYYGRVSYVTRDIRTRQCYSTGFRTIHCHCINPEILTYRLRFHGLCNDTCYSSRYKKWLIDFLCVSGVLVATSGWLTVEDAAEIRLLKYRQCMTCVRLLPGGDNYNRKSHKYLCLTIYQPEAKSSPNPNPTTRLYQQSYCICLCVTVTQHFCSVNLKFLDLRHVSDDSNTN